MIFNIIKNDILQNIILHINIISKNIAYILKLNKKKKKTNKKHKKKLNQYTKKLILIFMKKYLNQIKCKNKNYSHVHNNVRKTNREERTHIQ